jgi:toxin FitB
MARKAFDRQRRKGKTARLAKQNSLSLFKQNPDKAREIESWLTSVEMSYAFIPTDSACFRHWARMVRGRSSDLRGNEMIAATARVHGFTVATRDEKDFKHLGVDIFNPFKSTHS